VSGERISSCMAESTVNAVISKRFAPRQQMRWMSHGADLLLQTRTRALDGTLRLLFKRCPTTTLPKLSGRHRQVNLDWCLDGNGARLPG
jgi:hypothetical protein